MATFNCIFINLLFSILLTFSRGVILYAMVCGSLPFGDDAQVAKMVTKPLTFSRPITQGNHYNFIIQCHVIILPICTSLYESSD